MNSILSFLSSSIRNALAILLSVLGSALAMPASADTVTYYHNDLLGTPIAASDATGKVIWRRAYDPFGAQVASTASTSNVRIDYTGHTKDAETGLVNMGARMYNPEIGMFYGLDQATIDPHNEFSFNRYAYANQNPYRYVDPDGKEAVPAIILTGLIVIGAVAVSSYISNPEVQHSVSDILHNLPDIGFKGSKYFNESKEDEGTPKEGESDESGAYVNGHESGKVYVGKGGKERSQESGKREANNNEDPHTWTEWKKTPNDREGFKEESRLLDKHGGHKSENTYNRRDSPGKKYRKQDGEL